MLRLKTLPCLHRPHPLFTPHPFPLGRRRRPSALSLAAMSSSSAAASAATVIEHVVLFKVRPTTSPSQLDAMLSNLRSLTSLDLATHLAVAPIIRPRSAAAKDAAFTHLLHSRYPSKPDLAAYSAHPAHVAVVKNDVLPICDDIMALDWEVPAHLTNPISPPPGSAVRLTLAKPKDEVESSVLAAAIAGVEDSEAAKSAVQVSYGENFSPARAKGYGVGFLAVYPGLEELDKVEAEAVEGYKEKVRPLLENVIVVDFVIPELPPSASI